MYFPDPEEKLCNYNEVKISDISWGKIYTKSIYYLNINIMIFIDAR